MPEDGDRLVVHLVPTVKTPECSSVSFEELDSPESPQRDRTRSAAEFGSHSLWKRQHGGCAAFLLLFISASFLGSWAHFRPIASKAATISVTANSSTRVPFRTWRYRPSLAAQPSEQCASKVSTKQQSAEQAFPKLQEVAMERVSRIEEVMTTFYSHTAPEKVASGSSTMRTSGTSTRHREEKPISVPISIRWHDEIVKPIKTTVVAVRDNVVSTLVALALKFLPPRAFRQVQTFCNKFGLSKFNATTGTASGEH